MKFFQITLMILITSVIGISQEVYAIQDFTFIVDEGLWSNPSNWEPQNIPDSLNCEIENGVTICDKVIIPEGRMVEQDIFIENNGIIENSGTIKILNSIEGDGEIRNQALGIIEILDGGSIELNVDGTLINEGQIILNDGIFDLEGILQNKKLITNKGTIENFGIINNQCGTIDNFDSITIFIENNFGIINNLVCNNGNSIINNNLGSSIENFGTINNEDKIFDLGGSINNYDTGVINNNGRLKVGEGQLLSSLNNFGTINNKANGIIENNGEIINGLIIFNSGIINNNLHKNNSDKIISGITNDGKIINDCKGIFNDNGGFFEGNPVETDCTDELFCGKPKSVWEPNIFVGTSGNDVLKGTKQADLILGLGGNDIIFGNKGNDCLIGGPGNDKIFGGHGDDIIEGNEGNDLIFGHHGNDMISGGPGNDKIFGGHGDDQLFGNEGNDYLDGERGRDFCDGGSGQNKLKNCETTPQPQCTAATIDFEGLSKGTIVDKQFATLGILISVDNDKSNHPDKGIIFDSANPSGKDEDLRTPASLGNIKDLLLGKILIIAENIIDKNNDGLVDDPDDEEMGGSIFLKFDKLQCSFGFDLIDIEEQEAKNGFIEFTFGNSKKLKIKFDEFTDKKSQFFDNSVVFGDNSANRFFISQQGLGKTFNEIAIHLYRSGAIDNLLLNTQIP